MTTAPAFAQTSAPATSTAPATGPSPLTQMLPFVLVFVIFYFLVIRPQNEQRKKHQQMVNAVKKGDEVVLSGGILGKVTKTVDGTDEVMVEIADKVAVRVLKQTLSQVRTAADSAANDR